MRVACLSLLTLVFACKKAPEPTVPRPPDSSIVAGGSVQDLPQSTLFHTIYSYAGHAGQALRFYGPEMEKRGAHLDGQAYVHDNMVNSGGELHKARVVDFRPDQIVFNGVSKTDEEIRAAVEYGILAINIDSLFELEQVARVARSIGGRANVAIRIVPEIITRSHIGLQTGLLASKFGLSPAQIDDAFRIALNDPSLGLSEPAAEPRAALAGASTH